MEYLVAYQPALSMRLMQPLGDNRYVLIANFCGPEQCRGHGVIPGGNAHSVYAHQPYPVCTRVSWKSAPGTPRRLEVQLWEICSLPKKFHHP